MSTKSKVNALKAVDLIHDDDGQHKSEVSPSISVSTSKWPSLLLIRNPYVAASKTAFRHAHPDDKFTIEDWDPRNPSRHLYSRYTQDVSTRVERILSKINVCGAK